MNFITCFCIIAKNIHHVKFFVENYSFGLKGGVTWAKFMSAIAVNYSKLDKYRAIGAYRAISDIGNDNIVNSCAEMLGFLYQNKKIQFLNPRFASVIYKLLDKFGKNAIIKIIIALQQMAIEKSGKEIVYIIHPSNVSIAQSEISESLGKSFGKITTDLYFQDVVCNLRISSGYVCMFRGMLMYNTLQQLKSDIAKVVLKNLVSNNV